MKVTAAQIKQILAHLEASIPAARQSRDRALMAETILRIRQMRGLLEVRA